MAELVSWDVPTDITEDYYLIIGRWHELKRVLNSEDRKHYLVLVENFVAEIDGFVYKLQEYSEYKLIKLAWAGGIGLGGILVISLFVVHSAMHVHGSLPAGVAVESSYAGTRDYTLHVAESN